MDLNTQLDNDRHILYRTVMGYESTMSTGTSALSTDAHEARVISSMPITFSVLHTEMFGLQLLPIY